MKSTHIIFKKRRKGATCDLLTVGISIIIQRGSAANMVGYLSSGSGLDHIMDFL